MFFFRVRFLIRIVRPVPQLHPVPAPLVYALLCQAWAEGSGEPPYLPPEAFVIAPEQLRVQLSIGEEYAFGLNLLCDNLERAREIVRVMTLGLQRLGQNQPARKQTLAGNFELLQTEDLFGKRILSEGDSLEPLSGEWFLEECRRLQERPSAVTLNFQTPLRWQLPRSRRGKKDRYFDREHFDVPLFLGRLKKRLDDCGLDTSGAPENLALEQGKLLANHLVWLDIDYRNAQQKSRTTGRFKLSGVSGIVRLELPPDFPRHWLVWSQYIHLGESTRFGLGSFRIEELGPDPFPCHRSQSLLELSCSPVQLQQAAFAGKIDPQEVHRAATRMISGKYKPAKTFSVTLESPGESRELRIPQPVDMALQRCVQETVAPGLDLLFEESSFAYRRGLGRFHAAKAIQKAWDKGYRWAAQADFECFFDSIPHAELESRLHAYVADRKLISLVMAWVRSAPLLAKSQRGLPTGAPLSPLLANLFLDHFDEQIASRGGKLVRFADDFLILTREKHEAEKMFEVARKTAEQLCLQLNKDKAYLVELNAGFEFLGFRFEKRTDWAVEAKQHPVEMERLGWFDASRDRPVYAPRFLLAGEAGVPATGTSTVCIVEPETTWLGVREGRLTTMTANRVHKLGPALESIHQILIPGPTSLDESLWKAMDDYPVVIVMTDEFGNALTDCFPEQEHPTAETLFAQVDVTRDKGRSLLFARQIIHAKLMNYAALSQVIPVREAESDVPQKLRHLANQAGHAESLDQLLGYEGAGAAAWYGSFQQRIPSRFQFSKRVAPNASDPVNVLLNMAQTHLYRQCCLAARITGLSPTLGVLHQPGPGHAALASDFQEPFRILAERAAIETLWKVEPSDFIDSDDGAYPLVISNRARSRLLGTFYQALAQPILSTGAQEPISFRGHLFRLARSYRTALLQGTDELRCLICP